MMRIQKQPNRWSCGPTALAILLDQSVDDIIKVIGHDGSEIIYPKLGEPDCRRSFCLDDIIETAWRLGTGLVLFQASPIVVREEPNESYRIEYSEDRITSLMQDQPGLVIGRLASDRPHMVAWDGRLSYDPQDAQIKSLELTIEVFLASISRIKSN